MSPGSKVSGLEATEQMIRPILAIKPLIRMHVRAPNLFTSASENNPIERNISTLILYA